MRQPTMSGRLVLFFLLALSLSSVAFGAEITGLVVGIIDGDTLDVLHDGAAERIRLNGIDCPEKGQAFGRRAKQLASDLAFQQSVTVTTHQHDRYGRTIGSVILPDGRLLSSELVREGMCWWYRKYARGNAVLERLEAEAREAKRGLWADPNPVPPWDFRKSKRSAIDSSALTK